ncbi:MAG: outer membrane lipoprotein-sorting protein [Chromatiales bacterium]|nr:outer membrane lipoprotein-sorting protein [Chromatiales bacterium]
MGVVRFAFLLLTVVPALGALASEPPAGGLTADEIVREVYEVAHGNLVRNALSKRHGDVSALIVNRVPLSMRDDDRKPLVQTFDTYVNNSPGGSGVKSKQLAILTSGKARGTGVLVTTFVDASTSSMIQMWFPALRKVRRINEPPHDDTWFGTNLTYGELVLRRPEHEIHELLGEGVMEGCLGSMTLTESEQTRYTQDLPAPQCAHRGRGIWRIKSTTKFEHWWYDYHISEIDRETFAVYRTVYFKGDERIKTVEVDWQSLDQPDPRITYPRYIYAVTLTDGKDSLVYVPRETIELNTDLPDRFWSESTLKRYRP